MEEQKFSEVHSWSLQWGLLLLCRPENMNVVRGVALLVSLPTSCVSLRNTLPTVKSIPNYPLPFHIQYNNPTTGRSLRALPTDSHPFGSVESGVRDPVAPPTNSLQHPSPSSSFLCTQNRSEGRKGGIGSLPATSSFLSSHPWDFHSLRFATLILCASPLRCIWELYWNLSNFWGLALLCARP